MNNSHLEERLKYAKEQLQIGNYGRVERAANELINSNDAEFLKDGLFYKGMSLSFQGNTTEAIDYFNQAIETDPNFEFAYYYRLDNLFRVGQIHEARADAKKLISLDDQNVLYYEKLAAIDMEMGDNESAEAIANKVLEIEPENIAFIALRADMRSKQKKYAAAIEDYLKLQASEEFEHMDQISTYTSTGFAYLQTKDYESAKMQLEKAKALNSNHPLALAYLGYTLTHLDQMDDGVELINDAIDINPDISYPYLLLAKAAIVLEEMEDAKECIELAQERDPEGQYKEEIDELLKKLE